MKKGFTLIELLAVIVILAIIALIATPIVLNIIEEVNQSGSIESMKNLERAVELYYANNQIKEDIVFDCNKVSCKYGENVLNIKGKSSFQGKILVDKNGKITYNELLINGYNCYKDQDEYICSKEIVKKIFTESSIFLNASRGTNLLDYNIYGSVDGVGDITSNLLNPNTVAEVNNYIDSRSGATTTSSLMWRVSDFISVLGGKTYHFNAINSNATVAGIAWYDANKVYISGINTTTINQNNGNIESPSNASYVRISWRIDEGYNPNWKNTVQFFEKSIDAVYESNSYKISIKIMGKNLFDIENRTLGVLSSGGPNTNIRKFELDRYYVGLTMNNYYYPTYVKSYSVSDKDVLIEVSSSGYGLGFPFKVKPNTKYSISRETGLYVGVVFYTDQGEYISNVLKYNFETPENCKTMVVVLRPKETNEETVYTNIQLEEGDSKTEYEPYKETVINIYINEPLRCVEETCDYINFKNQKVVRYVEKLEDGSLKVLNDPIEEKIELPSILLNKGINNISVETSVSPSKIELEYYK